MHYMHLIFPNSKQLFDIKQGSLALYSWD